MFTRMQENGTHLMVQINFVQTSMGNGMAVTQEDKNGNNISTTIPLVGIQPEYENSKAKEIMTAVFIGPLATIAMEQT